MIIVLFNFLLTAVFCICPLHSPLWRKSSTAYYAMFRVRFPHPSHDTLRYCPAWPVSGHWAKLSQRNNKTFSALTARLTVNSQPTYRVPEFLTKTKCRLYNCPGSATHRLVKLAQWLFHLLDAFRSVWIFNVAAIGTRSVLWKYFSYSHWTNRYCELFHGLLFWGDRYMIDRWI